MTCPFYLFIYFLNTQVGLLCFQSAWIPMLISKDWVPSGQLLLRSLNSFYIFGKSYEVQLFFFKSKTYLCFISLSIQHPLTFCSAQHSQKYHNTVMSRKISKIFLEVTSRVCRIQVYTHTYIYTHTLSKVYIYTQSLGYDFILST